MGHKNTLFGYFFIEEGMTLCSSVEAAFNYGHDAVIDWFDWYNTKYGTTFEQDPVMFDWYTGDLYL